MPHVEITRVISNDGGTFGVLHINGEPVCVTLEDPWRDNQRNVSCIPAGTYDCDPFTGSKYTDVWQVMDVPDRSYILIHQGNTTDDTEGCILVGTQFGTLKGRPAILRSMEALTMLRARLPDEFTMTIRNAWR